MNHCYSTSTILILDISFVLCKQIQGLNAKLVYAFQQFIDLILEVHFTLVTKSAAFISPLFEVDFTERKLRLVSTATAVAALQLLSKIVGPTISLEFFKKAFQEL